MYSDSDDMDEEPLEPCMRQRWCYNWSIRIVMKWFPL